MATARNNRKRKRGRRRFGLLFKLLCVLAVVVALTVGATVFFRVEAIAVSGNSRYHQQEIIDATGIQMGDNLFQMNKFELERQVEQALPYIEDVRIRRSLPSTVVVTVTEWDAVARVQGGGENWLVSVGGKLLEPAPGDSAVMAVSGLTPLQPQAGRQLAVSQEEEPRLEALVALLTALKEKGMEGQVSSVELTATRVTLRYLDRFDVKLPLSTDFDYKLDVLLQVAADQDEKTGGSAAGSIDLTQEGYHAVYSPE